MGTLSVTALLLLASGGAGVALVLTAAAGALGVRTGPAGVLTVTLRS